MAINFSNINSVRPAPYSAQMQQASQDRRQAASISTQVRAEVRKGQANQSHNVRSETALRVHEMHRETSINRSRSGEQIHPRVLQLMGR